MKLDQIHRVLRAGAGLAWIHGSGLAAGIALASVAGAAVQSPSGAVLLKALQGGGYVLLMRHGSSPRTPPDPAHADAENVRHERQLDAEGRSTVRAMGDALRRLRIPIGAVLSSPTYRALETVRLGQFGHAITFRELGDSGQSMLADASGVRGAWLRAKAADAPVAGNNTLIVTHFPNIIEAFGQSAAGLADGEALVLHPDGRGGTVVVARVKIAAWAHLDAAP